MVAGSTFIIRPIVVVAADAVTALSHLFNALVHKTSLSKMMLTVDLADPVSRPDRRRCHWLTVRCSDQCFQLRATHTETAQRRRADMCPVNSAR